MSGGAPHGALPWDVAGTTFQSRVWRYLLSISSEEAQSYQQVARGIGQPTAARAVARACATNRVALVIPCHRVIRGTGSWAATVGGWSASRRYWIRNERPACDIVRTHAVCTVSTFRDGFLGAAP